MPTYSYRCDKCGFKFDNIVCISQRNQTQKCPECLGPASRDVETEVRSRSEMNEDHPRWSWSMGCATPEEGREHLKKHPDIEFKFGDHGPVLVRNRQEKLKLMKYFGMEEY